MGQPKRLTKKAPQLQGELNGHSARWLQVFCAAEFRAAPLDATENKNPAVRKSSLKFAQIRSGSLRFALRVFWLLVCCASLMKLSASQRTDALVGLFAWCTCSTVVVLY